MVALNSAFAAEARRNILHDPGIYCYNVARNFLSFNLDTMQFWPHQLLFANSPSRSIIRNLSDIWIFPLLFLSLAGVVWCAVRGDPPAWVVIAVYFGIVFAHTIAFSTQLYTCVRLPMVTLGFILLIGQLENTRLFRSGPLLAHCTTYAMTAWGVIATVLAVIH